MDEAGVTSSATRHPLPRERNLIIAALLVLATVAWALIIWQSSSSSDDQMMRPTAGMTQPVFLGIWVAMMVAMMFPSAAPMILAFARVEAARAVRGDVVVPVTVFVAAYLLVWTAFGAVAFALASATEALADHSMWLSDHAGHLGGALMIVAGAYQLSPLKRACLSKCRLPVSWLLHSWREGAGGAFRLGVEHGAYCLGCCWLLFVILFPLGVMNIAAMALIAALILAEKSLPMSRIAVTGSALALVAYGVAVLASPALLPTTM
ncbi:MAG TPA: DUF2182 domain-containing protein [Candidatus Limnocylindria bacterium]|nr:DUF2182 domain-containing protein [Candidatus Limnocylindria bacterium]